VVVREHVLAEAVIMKPSILLAVMVMVITILHLVKRIGIEIEIEIGVVVERGGLSLGMATVPTLLFIPATHFLIVDLFFSTK